MTIFKNPFRWFMFIFAWATLTYVAEIGAIMTGASLTGSFWMDTTINTQYVIWALQRIRYINPKVHWSTSSDGRTQNIRKDALCKIKEIVRIRRRQRGFEILFQDCQMLFDHYHNGYYNEWTVIMICSLHVDKYIPYMSDLYSIELNGWNYSNSLSPLLLSPTSHPLLSPSLPVSPLVNLT